MKKSCGSGESVFLAGSTASAEVLWQERAGACAFRAVADPAGGNGGAGQT
jgi:hypothetical protein